MFKIQFTRVCEQINKHSMNQKCQVYIIERGQHSQMEEEGARMGGELRDVWWEVWCVGVGPRYPWGAVQPMGADRIVGCVLKKAI